MEHLARCCWPLLSVAVGAHVAAAAAAAAACSAGRTGGTAAVGVEPAAFPGCRMPEEKEQEM